MHISEKHDERYTDWFCLLGLLAVLIAPNWLTVVASYFAFQVLGISLGLHRIAGHGYKVYKPAERLFFVLGLLSHAGPLKGSALDHARHHYYDDSTDGTEVAYNSEPFIKVLGKSRVRAILNRFDWFANWLDDHYYAWLVPTWVLLCAIDPGILLGAATATAVHTWATGYLHHPVGYRNFEAPGSNSIWLWPLFLGENWHNNHHGVLSNNYQVKWWELDVGYHILRLFRKS